LEVAFQGKLVSDLTASSLTDFFKRGQVSKKSYNNRRGIDRRFPEILPLGLGLDRR